MKEKLKGFLALSLAMMPAYVYADNRPITSYNAFKARYGEFSGAFNNVLTVAFQGILVLIALNIVLAVAALVVAGAKLGVSSNAASRSDAQSSLLNQAIVFGLLGITPLVFALIGTYMF